MERARPADAALARAGVDAHLDKLRGELKAPRRAKRALKKSGGVSLSRGQMAAGRRWARAAERGEVPAEVSKPSRGAKVLKRNRGVGRRPW